MIIYTRKNTYPLTWRALVRGMRTRRQQVRLLAMSVAVASILIAFLWLITAWMIERGYRISAIDRAVISEREHSKTSLSLANCFNKRAIRESGTRTVYFCEVSEQRDL